MDTNNPTTTQTNIDKNEENIVNQPPKPLDWHWLAQREATNGIANSLWIAGFLASDGCEVRVTFHQVGEASQQAPQAPSAQQAPPQEQEHPIEEAVNPTVQPDDNTQNLDSTENSTFYVTFFASRNPEFFMKWDTSLAHEDSLAVWVTITYAIVDFVRKAVPKNIILDDLANGKLKMVLRSVALDVVAANPQYTLEQTQKHHYRSFFQIKKAGSGSAFVDNVQGTDNEGDTNGQSQLDQRQQQNQPTENPPTPAGDKTEDPTNPQPAFPSVEPAPIKQTAPIQRGLTVEIGRDNSVAVKDSEGNALDRYRAKGPADILRWINDKGFANNKMVIVDKEQPSNNSKKPIKKIHKSKILKRKGIQQLFKEIQFV